jgi:hypothetical protein
MRAIYEIKARVQMKPVNCFTIRGDRAEEGILFTSGDTQELPTLRDFVPRSEPQTVIGRSSEGNNLKHFAGGEFFYVFLGGLESLKFGDQPFCKGLNLWAGGELEEGSKILWKSRETRGDPKRRELWRVRKRYRLILVDCYGGIRIVSNHGESLDLRPPSVDEVAAFFREYLKKVDASPNAANKERQLRWGRENLGILLREHSGV